MNPIGILSSLLAIGFLVLAALAMLVYDKARKIHLATYRLEEHALATRRETEALFSQFQALLGLERRLGLAEALPPLRGWAGSPDFLLAVAEETLSSRPRLVVECSSGSSTVVIARCLQLNGQGRVMSLEHDPVYAAKTRDLLARHGLQDWATVVDAPLQAAAGGAPWYDLGRLPTEGEIDLLVVDGPPAATAPQARYPAVPRLAGRMSPRAVVMLDDADRPDERAIVDRWAREQAGWHVSRLPAEKGLAVLRRAAG